MTTEVKEGTGRAKLPQLLVMMDTRTLKAVAEFKTGSVGLQCRFCAGPLGEVRFNGGGWLIASCMGSRGEVSAMEGVAQNFLSGVHVER